MKKLLFLLLLLPGMALSAQKSEEKQVCKSFDAYKKAILNDRGEEAVKYVDSRTVKYYDDMARLVKNADSASVAGLSLMDRLMVFSIRHRATQEEIPGFDGRKLLVYAIQNGMVGKNSVAGNEIGEVTIQGDFAKGQFSELVVRTDSASADAFYRKNGFSADVGLPDVTHRLVLEQHATNK